MDMSNIIRLAMIDSAFVVHGSSLSLEHIEQSPTIWEGRITFFISFEWKGCNHVMQFNHITQITLSTRLIVIINQRQFDTIILE